MVAVAARRLKIPYAAGLVLIGQALGLLGEQNINISPQLILAVPVPPLVFDAAFHIRLEDLRRDFWLILLLAVPSVILTTLMAGWLVAQGAGLAIPIAMVFGALVSATDPVAVVALFRQPGAPSPCWWAELRSSAPRWTRTRNFSMMKLIIAIVHHTDGEEILQALTEAHFRVTRIASSGGFFALGGMQPCC